MLNIFRDQTRDVLARELAGVGIKAKIGERGREEEKIRSGFKWLFQGSLGVIDIEDGVVKWVNVVRLKRRDKNSPPPVHRVVFGIPDHNLPESHHPLKLLTVRKKSFPLFGKVVKVDWKGDSVLLPLITDFSNDVIVDQVVKELGNLQVRTHPGRFRGFTVEVDRKFRPTLEHWKAIQKIAGYLLASSRNL
jgi:hypothetical protein